MGQAKPLDDQPSMDEILASIRRIIDRGEADNVPPAPANDPNAPADNPSQNDNSVPPHAGIAADAQPSVHRPPLNQADLERFSQTIDARAPEAGASLDASASVASISDAASSKYEGRFTEDDNRAFQAVADALSAGAPSMPTPVVVDEPLQPSGSGLSPASMGLISETARVQVGASFEALSDVLQAQNGRDLEQVTEDILRPMLSDWLDNNLPSIVEKLVRAEIEAIARGTPRQG